MSKKDSQDLAMFGGQPTFLEPLHVGRPNVADRQRLLARINDLLDRRWLTNHGRYVQEFEDRLSEMLGVRHCIPMCNGTVAMEIAVRACGLKGEVIVPSFTFVATPHSLQWQEITPVFCDIDPDTHNLDPDRVEDLITPRTTGIIGVHVWGRPCSTEALEDISRRQNVRLLYDAAHAFSCSHGGRMVGNFGDAEVFSFHATKFLNSFEGGAVATNDDTLATRIRLMKNFGFAGLDRVVCLGTNGKMSEVSAAMGLTMLESKDELIETNRRNYLCYRENLAGVAGLKLITYDEHEHHNYHYVVADLNEEEAQISRDLLVDVLHAENVRVRRYFYPGCHRMEPYRSYFPHAGLLLPVTEELVQRVVVFPTGTAVTEDEIKRVCELVRFVIENADEISHRVAPSSPATHE